jgi:hypothetical protein
MVCDECDGSGDCVDGSPCPFCNGEGWIDLEDNDEDN